MINELHSKGSHKKINCIFNCTKSIVFLIVFSGIPERQGGSIDVTPEELKSVMYTPIPNEWPAGGRDIDNDRCARGFEQIMELRIAEHFLAPVDLNLYPAYARVVAYPMDLNTIKERLHNRYYR